MTKVEYMKRYLRSELFLGKARIAVAKRGGTLLSADYLNAKSVMTVRCVNGHAFETTYDRLQQGKWCRRCPRPQRYAYTIDHMRAHARQRGGDCLSPEFRGIKTKLDWLCPRHGSFQASPSNVIHNGSWCPQCGRERSAGLACLGLTALAAGPPSV